MSFSGTTARATAECAGTVSTSAEGVSTSAGAVCSLTGAVTTCAETVCSFRWSHFLCFRLSFLFWKIYLMKF